MGYGLFCIAISLDAIWRKATLSAIRQQAGDGPLEDVLLPLFRAHGEQCRDKNHCEKDRCENQVMKH